MNALVRLLAVLSAGACPAGLALASTGGDLFVRADKGNCIACHQLPPGAGPEVRADVGPRLDAARLKAWERERLRDYVADPTRFNPETVMPPYGRHRLLDASEIESVVDFLRALP